MTYLEAKQLKEKNLHIIGLKYKGGTIDEIIIHPTNQENFKKFIEVYLDLDSSYTDNSISQFFQEDVDISVIIDKENTWENGMFLFTNLLKLENENLNLNL